MKLFVALMAIILLAQSFMPCSDKLGIATKTKAQITQATSHQQTAPDDCPPLCNCSCCGSSISSLNFISYNLTKSFNYINHLAEYLPSAIQKVALPIWQPPQL